MEPQRSSYTMRDARCARSLPEMYGVTVHPRPRHLRDQDRRHASPSTRYRDDDECVELMVEAHAFYAVPSSRELHDGARGGGYLPHVKSEKAKKAGHQQAESFRSAWEASPSVVFERIEVSSATQYGQQHDELKFSVRWGMECRFRR